MSHDEISRAVILVIPHWFSQALAFVAFVLALASYWRRWRANKGWTKLAEKCAEAADGYARSDEALAPVQDALGQPDQAAYTRVRVVLHREMAQQLRERNRRRGRKGLFRAPQAAVEPRTPPGRSEAADEASGAAQGDLRAEVELDPRR